MEEKEYLIELLKYSGGLAHFKLIPFLQVLDYNFIQAQSGGLLTFKAASGNAIFCRVTNYLNSSNTSVDNAVFEMDFSGFPELEKFYPAVTPGGPTSSIDITQITGPGASPTGWLLFSNYSITVNVGAEPNAGFIQLQGWQIQKI